VSYRWEVQKINLEHFSPDEFDHPERMDPEFLKDIDVLRMRCGFPLEITDDARTKEEMEILYAPEIALGKGYPRDSAHLYAQEQLVRCVDIKPAKPKANDGCPLSYVDRLLELDYQILRMWKEGRWKHLGLGYETAHTHIDDTPRLGSKRPARWVQPSR
jgi:hypothetical protein